MHGADTDPDDLRAARAAGTTAGRPVSVIRPHGRPGSRSLLSLLLLLVRASGSAFYAGTGLVLRGERLPRAGTCGPSGYRTSKLVIDLVDVRARG